MTLRKLRRYLDELPDYYLDQEAIVYDGIINKLFEIISIRSLGEKDLESADTTLTNEVDEKTCVMLFES